MTIVCQTKSWSDLPFGLKASKSAGVEASLWEEELNFCLTKEITKMNRCDEECLEPAQIQFQTNWFNIGD